MALGSTPALVNGAVKNLITANDSFGNIGFAHSAIDQNGVAIVVAQDGVDAIGVTVPTGGVGIRGWLSGIYSQESPIQGVIAMTVGTAITAQRGVRIKCTVAGNVSLTYVNGSTDVIPINVGLSETMGAITTINTSGTTATATYSALV